MVLQGIAYTASTSPDMLAIARKNAPQAEFHRTCVLSAVIPKCEAVTAIGECLSYAFGSDAGSITAFFRRIYRALPAQGVFIFDYARSGPNPGGMPRKAYWTGEDWAVLVESGQESSGVLTRRITCFRQTGGTYRRSEEEHRLRLFNTGEVQLQLEAVGFEARPLKGFGAYRFLAGHGAFRVSRAAKEFSMLNCDSDSVTSQRALAAETDVSESEDGAGELIVRLRAQLGTWHRQRVVSAAASSLGTARTASMPGREGEHLSRLYQ
ncbi:MAG: hypothetical protein WKF37_21255 [Bryobacteraceae bacterium]